MQRIKYLDSPSVNMLLIIYNFKDEHPFRLTTKHGISIKPKLHDYDWNLNQAEIEVGIILVLDYILCMI